MTTQDIEPIYPAAPRTNVSQATAVEQQRATAEVQAMVVVAQQVPRDMVAAQESMRESCRMKALAERAFFRYPRGGKQITGPSVHLARELARCFGNVTYGLIELRRDDEGGESEMQAFAWDLQTNTRSSSTFVVPHRRDTQQGPKHLTDMREVYENNANQGARRMREAIFAILPPWYVEEAKELCSQTLQGDVDGKPLPRRIADSVDAFLDNFEVTLDQLESKLGRKRAQWNAHDLATLTVIYKSLSRGESTVDEEFEPRRVTAGEITGGAPPEPKKKAAKKTSKKKTAAKAKEQEVPPPPDDEPAATSGSSTGAEASDDQRAKFFAHINELGIDDDRRRAWIKGRHAVDSYTKLSRTQVAELIDALEDRPGDVLAEAEGHWRSQRMSRALQQMGARHPDYGEVYGRLQELMGTTKPYEAGADVWAGCDEETFLGLVERVERLAAERER